MQSRNFYKSVLHLAMFAPFVLAMVLIFSTRVHAADAGQFLLLDEVIEFKDNWRPKDPAWAEKPSDGFYMAWLGEHFRQRRSKEIPDSWLTPKNYAEGRVFTRVEVLKKPDNLTPSGIILRMVTDEHAGNHTYWLCTKTCKFSKTGLYHYEENVKDGTRPYGNDFRFDAPLWELQVVVTDNKDGIVHKKWEGGYAGKPNLALYLPLTVRVSTFVVAKGEQFNAPPWWKAADAKQRRVHSVGAR